MQGPNRPVRGPTWVWCTNACPSEGDTSARRLPATGIGATGTVLFSGVVDRLCENHGCVLGMCAPGPVPGGTDAMLL